MHFLKFLLSFKEFKPNWSSEHSLFKLPTSFSSMVTSLTFITDRKTVINTDVILSIHRQNIITNLGVNRYLYTFDKL